MDIQYLYRFYLNWLDTYPIDISSGSRTLVTDVLYVLCHFNFDHCPASPDEIFIQKEKFNR